MKHTVILLVAGLCTACVIPMDDESLGGPGEVVEDCVVPVPDALQSWGAPVGLEYEDQSLWIWNDVTLANGTQARRVGAVVPDAETACAGDLALVTDATGIPLPLLGLTSAEETENATRTDGRQVRLTVTGGFVHEGRAHLYYEKTLTGPGFFDAERLGTGLCTMDQPGDICERATPERYADDPTLLWDATERPLNRGAYLDEDGHAYVWGCFHVAAFEDRCSLARVPVDEAADPTAYRYYNGFDGWIEDGWNSTTLLDSGGSLTPAYNPHLQRHVLYVANIWESTLNVRIASSPVDWYARPLALFDADPPPGWFMGGGSAHSGLRSADGRTVAVSYYGDVGNGASGLHLVTYRFGEGG